MEGPTPVITLVAIFSLQQLLVCYLGRLGRFFFSELPYFFISTTADLIWQESHFCRASGSLTFFCRSSSSSCCGRRSAKSIGSLPALWQDSWPVARSHSISIRRCGLIMPRCWPEPPALYMGTYLH